MPYCGVDGCKNRSATSSLKKNGVTFHSFPKEPATWNAWVKACNRELSWRPTGTSTVCSRHFTEDQFQGLPNKRRLLVAGAVPTLALTTARTFVSKESDKDSEDFLSKKEVTRILDNTARKMKEKVGEKNKTIHRLQSQILYLKKKVEGLKKKGPERDAPVNTIKMMTRKLISQCVLKDRRIHALRASDKRLQARLLSLQQRLGSDGPTVLRGGPNENTRAGDQSPGESSPDDDGDEAPESQAQLTNRLRARAAALERGTKTLEARIKVLERQNKTSQDSLNMLRKLNEGLARRCLHMEKKNEKLRLRLQAMGARSSSDEDDDEMPLAKRTNPAPSVDDDSGAEDVGKRPRFVEPVKNSKPSKKLFGITYNNNKKIKIECPSNVASNVASPFTRNQPSYSPTVENTPSPLVLISNNTLDPPEDANEEDPSTSSFCEDNSDPLSLWSTENIKIEESDITIEEHNTY